MGNASSSGRGHHEETVDFGHLSPQGIYTGPRDWNQSIVTQLIVDRKLAPFYRPLEDYEEAWDDEQIIAAMKEPPQAEGGEAEGSSARAESASLHSSSSRTHHKRPSATTKEPARQIEVGVYRGAVDCPICFLYYPANINHSRCCDQAICTECFVQIKRAEPTATHLVSEPASCPYCVQENFGVVYTPPSWRAGINSEGAPPPIWTTPGHHESPAATMQRRRKSVGADSPEVVTVDQIRPDWEAKLAAVRAAVARRANRRIIMRQVGDRLIPIGISSGRIHPLQPEDVAGESGESGSSERGSRRSRRRNQNPDLNQYLGQGGFTGQDLEELMVMEAMRLSLLDHEEQQRKEREEEEKKRREAGVAAGTSSSATDTPSSAVQTTPAMLSPTVNSSTTRLRSSSSVSGRSAELLPGSGRASQRSSSPASVIVTAIRAATSAASAVGSPPPEPDAADATTEGPDRTTLEATPTTTTRELPWERSMSFSSSISPTADGGSTYDYLPSSAGSSSSSLAQQPLLASPSVHPPRVPGGTDDGASQTE
ncbi:hypothetical protein PHLGIDRAFT_29131 [Phlebiopsis gigantea 11061_1 CR5-6]|uniref:RING-type domain-containing protein n=1 Tax=Phlebiopsis gigantea (strain 11061_1 CR5-6) TaxID=745531 RepID=A0A0C3SAL1_PHLG1|nr:hypothetical protein PHLGIDRAFT_29131 [Phlebiopsis gigantea 11061_1 CR5-6]